MDASILVKNFETNLLVKYIFQIEHHWLDTSWRSFNLFHVICVDVHVTLATCSLVRGRPDGPVMKNKNFIFWVWLIVNLSKIGSKVRIFPSEPEFSISDESLENWLGGEFWKIDFWAQIFLSFSITTRWSDHFRVVNLTSGFTKPVNRLGSLSASYQYLVVNNFLSYGWGHIDY